MNEGYYEDIELSSNDTLDMIKDILTKSALRGELNPDEYVVVTDDCIVVGNESDFDSDVLYFAVKLDDIIDFDNIDEDYDFVDFSNIDTDLFLTNIS